MKVNSNQESRSMKLLDRFLVWVGWRKKTVESKPAAALRVAPTRSEIRKDMAQNGAWHSMPELMKEVDAKFAKLERTKFPRHRSNTPLSLAGRVGCYVGGPESAVPDIDLTQISQKSLAYGALPTFALMTMAECIEIKQADGTTGSIAQDWFYFMKVDKGDFKGVYPRFGGDIYECGVTVPKGKKWPQYSTVLGFVEVVGSAVHVLPYRTTQKVRIQPNGPRRNHVEIECPAWSTGMHAVNLSEGKWGLDKVFCYQMNLFCAKEAMWNVSVERKGIRLNFAIPDNDAPYFFQKRDKSDGRIFHAVKAHTRKTGQNVKTHYRGKRNFVWGRYNVTIQIPGRHRGSWLGLNSKTTTTPSEKNTPVDNLVPRLGAMQSY